MLEIQIKKKLMTPTLNYNTVENALAELDPPAIEIVLESDPWNVLEMVRSFEYSCLRMSLGSISQ